MQVTCGDGVQIAPLRDLALSPAVIPHGRRRTVGPKSYRVPISGGNRHNLTPRVHIARALVSTARSSCRTVREDGKRPPPAGGYANNTRPTADIALSVVVPPGRKDSTVRAQSHGVGPASVGSCVDVSDGDSCDVMPPANTALRGLRISCGHD